MKSSQNTGKHISRMVEEAAGTSFLFLTAFSNQKCPRNGHN